MYIYIYIHIYNVYIKTSPQLLTLYALNYFTTAAQFVRFFFVLKPAEAALVMSHSVRSLLLYCCNSTTVTHSVRSLLLYYFTTAHCGVRRGRDMSCRAATRGSGGIMSSCRHGWRREWAGSTNSRRVSTGRSMKSTSIPSRCRPCATTCSPQYVWARVLPQAWALLFDCN